ncbi:hypothetical protein SAMN05421753_108189 [Planctomicrobium piriforme]|uniref:Uncharacterized protein n=1 Tax=Planctomicrobium piriforme TaxID=1576369 RepID=A0A1I3HU56_9PLAN|nr:hypothetical protein SAMN05421753_108189 [Planctomicrobium piriforme]
MSHGSIAFLVIAGSALAWWFGVRTLFGERLGALHWIPVAIACLGIPIMIADVLFRSPYLSLTLICCWQLLGAALAIFGIVRTQWKQTES